MSTCNLLRSNQCKSHRLSNRCCAKLHRPKVCCGVGHIYGKSP